MWSWKLKKSPHFEASPADSISLLKYWLEQFLGREDKLAEQLADNQWMLYTACTATSHKWVTWVACSVFFVCVSLSNTNGSEKSKGTSFFVKLFFCIKQRRCLLDMFDEFDMTRTTRAVCFSLAGFLFRLIDTSFCPHLFCDLIGVVLHSLYTVEKKHFSKYTKRRVVWLLTTG